jgi:hypothetical protein
MRGQTGPEKGEAVGHAVGTPLLFCRKWPLTNNCKYFDNLKIKLDDIGGACSTNGGEEECI